MLRLKILLGFSLLSFLFASCDILFPTEEDDSSSSDEVTITFINDTETPWVVGTSVFINRFDVRITVAGSGISETKDVLSGNRESMSVSDPSGSYTVTVTHTRLTSGNNSNSWSDSVSDNVYIIDSLSDDITIESGSFVSSGGGLSGTLALNIYKK